jgi:hypothetical protein
VRCARMFTSTEKTRVLVLSKKIPLDYHFMFPERGVTVKMFMIFFEQHDFIEKWGTIGMLNEDAFDARHATRNSYKRRFACMRSDAERDCCICQAHRSRLATRAMRDSRGCA